MQLTHRPRRLRRSAAVRSLVRETHIHTSDLIYPMFVKEGEGIREPIDSMPGQFRFSVDQLVKECKEIWDLGIPAVNLFGYTVDKDDQATHSYDPNGLIQQAIRALKDAVPELCVQTDVALDPYTHHGHDGLVVDGEIVNDESVEVLCKMALSHAEAGVDWVAPSDMMDGRVAPWTSRATPR
jgi:porphobilinogen synthase